MTASVEQAPQVCKTSTPGSNPGGASICLTNFTRLVGRRMPSRVNRNQTVTNVASR